MCVFHIFKILQMVPNRAKLLIFSKFVILWGIWDYEDFITYGVKAGHLQTCMLNYTPLGENS